MQIEAETYGERLTILTFAFCNLHFALLLRVLRDSAVNPVLLTREAAAPEIGDFLEIRPWNVDVRSGRVFAHLFGVARAGNHDVYCGVGDAKGDSRLGQRFDGTVNQEAELRGLC